VRIFVTGATGFVGENVARDLAARGHEVIGATRETFMLEAPTIPDVEAVVHCAAIATVKDCEADPARAVRLNVDATRTLAREAARRGIPLVFTSTDLVFDGGDAPYAEDAPTSAPTLYGRTKADAERAVLEASADHAVLRLALVVGAHGGAPGGFLRWLVQGLRDRVRLPLYVNQRRAPLYAADIAPVVELVVDRRLGGIHHLASERSLTREAIGRSAARAFDLPDDAIVPTTLDRGPDLPSVDDCALDTRALRARGVTFTPLETALAFVRDRLR